MRILENTEKYTYVGKHVKIYVYFPRPPPPPPLRCPSRFPAAPPRRGGARIFSKIFSIFSVYFPNIRIYFFRIFFRIFQYTYMFPHFPIYVHLRTFFHIFQHTCIFRGPRIRRHAGEGSHKRAGDKGLRACWRRAKGVETSRVEATRLASRVPYLSSPRRVGGVLGLVRLNAYRRRNAPTFSIRRSSHKLQRCRFAGIGAMDALLFASTSGRATST